MYSDTFKVNRTVFCCGEIFLLCKTFYTFVFETSIIKLK